MIVAALDERAQFAFVNRRGFRSAGHFFAVDAAGAAPFGAFVAARHILPDEQAELVAPIVPAFRFNLDVLAGHVEAEFLQHFNVIAQRLVGRRGVKAVGPEALIERAKHEISFVVELDAEAVLVVARHRDFAHGEIRFD